MRNGIRNKYTPREKADQNLLNESVLSDLNLSVLSNLYESKSNLENMNMNSNHNLNSNEQLFISTDQYSCTQCELPPEILYDTDDSDTIKIKCEKHGIKSYLIKDFLQKMSKNTYHFYKCGFCQKNCQKNFTQIFQYCFHCKNILCPKCLIKHKSYQAHN